MRAEHPEARLLVHPECVPEVQDLADHVLSTGQMLELARRTAAGTFLVGTEEGILHALRKAAPQLRFVHLSPFMRCLNMKKITLEKIARALETGEPAITVAPEAAGGARRALEAMLAVAAG
jgi:quinolinate synthase